MSFEFNKLAAAVLMAGIIAMFSGFIARQLFHVERPEEKAYSIALLEGSGPTIAEPVAEQIEPILPLLADADVAKGETLFRACVACHTVDQGGANRVGPNLWDIVGRDHAAHAGFAFSPALQAYAGQPWTYEELNHFLANPRAYAPGTKMSYAGMRRVQDRADLVAYLRTLSDSPAPLPTQEEIDALTEASLQDDEVPAEEQSAEAGETEAGEAEAGETANEEDSAASTEDAAENGGGDTQTASAAGGEDGGLLAAIAAADPEQGQRLARQCVACHTFEAGGANKVGPNLYGVIGAAFAHLDNFNYSNAFKEAKAAGRVWSYEEIDAYLANPREFMPGNKMTYAGLRKAEDRAAVIAYLRQHHDDPPPLD